MARQRELQATVAEERKRRQEMFRKRSKSLFRKTLLLAKDTDAWVALIVRDRNGQIRSLRSAGDFHWPPSIQDLLLYHPEDTHEFIEKRSAMGSRKRAAHIHQSNISPYLIAQTATCTEGTLEASALELSEHLLDTSADQRSTEAKSIELTDMPICMVETLYSKVQTTSATQEQASRSASITLLQPERSSHEFKSSDGTPNRTSCVEAEPDPAEVRHTEQQINSTGVLIIDTLNLDVDEEEADPWSTEGPNVPGKTDTIAPREIHGRANLDTLLRGWDWIFQSRLK